MCMGRGGMGLQYNARQIRRRLVRIGRRIGFRKLFEGREPELFIGCSNAEGTSQLGTSGGIPVHKFLRFGPLKYHLLHSDNTF